MNEKYIEDLKAIKDIMDRSSRFISLSGLSGIFTGLTALAGALLAYYYFYSRPGYLTIDQQVIALVELLPLLLIAGGTLTVSTAFAIFFTTRKTIRRGQSVWNKQVKRLLINLSIPLTTGGMVCLIFLYNGFVGIVLPLTIIFYGLALIQGSAYTLNEIRSLGMVEVGLGILAFIFIPHSLLIWAFGFGVLHIIYGLYIQWKYQS